MESTSSSSSEIAPKNEETTPPSVFRDSPDSGYAPQFAPSDVSLQNGSMQQQYLQQHHMHHQMHQQQLQQKQYEEFLRQQHYLQYQHSQQIQHLLQQRYEPHLQQQYLRQLQQEQYLQQQQLRQQHFHYHQWLHDRQEEYNARQEHAMLMMNHRANKTNGGPTIAHYMGHHQTQTAGNQGQLQSSHGHSREQKTRFNVDAPEFVPRKHLQDTQNAVIPPQQQHLMAVSQVVAAPQGLLVAANSIPAPPGLAPIGPDQQMIPSVSNNQAVPCNQKMGSSTENHMAGCCNQSVAPKSQLSAVVNVAVKKREAAAKVSRIAPKNVETAPNIVEVASRKAANPETITPSSSSIVNQEANVVTGDQPTKDVRIGSQPGASTEIGEADVRDNEKIKSLKASSPKITSVQGPVKNGGAIPRANYTKENTNLTHISNESKSKKESSKPTLSLSKAAEKNVVQPSTNELLVARKPGKNTPTSSSKPWTVDTSVKESSQNQESSAPRKTIITAIIPNATECHTEEVSEKKINAEKSTSASQVEAAKNPNAPIPGDEKYSEKESKDGKLPKSSVETNEDTNAQEEENTNAQKKSSKKNKKASAKGKNAKKVNKTGNKAEEDFDDLLDQFAKIDAQNPEAAKANDQKPEPIEKKKRTVSQMRRENAAKKKTSPRIDVEMVSDVEIDADNCTLEDWQELDRQNQFDDDKWKDSMKIGFYQFMEDLNRSVSDQTPLEYWPDCPLFDRCEDPDVTADRRSSVCLFLNARITEKQTTGGTIPYMRRSLYPNLVHNYNAHLGVVIEPFMLLYAEGALTLKQELKLIAKIVNIREFKFLDCDIVPAFR